LNEPTEVTLSSGRRAPMRLEVHYISFSAHSDFAQTSEFITLLKPPHVVLVHGEANEMMRLKAGLQQRFEAEHLQVCGC
jgi:cleavage and polyadenylation specificity factor subunit 3